MKFCEVVYFFISIIICLFCGFFIGRKSVDTSRVYTYDELRAKYSTLIRERNELKHANEHMQNVINSYHLQEAQ